MEFDYVMVGAGSAGCVVTSRLSEDRVFIRAPLGFAAGASLKMYAARYHTVPQPSLGGRQGFQPRMHHAHHHHRQHQRTQHNDWREMCRPVAVQQLTITR